MTDEMENEKRLTDANALCKFFQERYEYLRNASETPLPNGCVVVDQVIQCGAIIAKEFLDKAKEAPTVDAVEVVRCKECECAVGHDGIHKTVLCQKRSAYPQQWDEMPFDGFCSYGERRKDET